MKHISNTTRAAYKRCVGGVARFICLLFLTCGCGRDKRREVANDYLKRCEATTKKSASEIGSRASVSWYTTKYDFQFAADVPSTVSVVDTVYYQRKFFDVGSQTTLDVKDVLSVSNLFAFFFTKQYVRHFSTAHTVPAITWYDRKGEPLTQCYLLQGGSPDDPVSRNKQELFRMLEGMESKAFTVATLDTLLGSDQPHVRLCAVQRLIRHAQERDYPPGGRNVSQLLTPLLNDPDGSVRAEVAFHLHTLHYGRPDRRGVLIEVLQSTDPRAREVAARHLGGAEYSRPDPVVKALLLALQDEDVHVRYAAAGALDGASTNKAPEIIHALTHTLTDQDKNVRGMATRVLGSYGAAAGEAIPALNQLLQDSDPTARQMAKTALARIQKASTSPKHVKGRPGGIETL